MRNEAAIFDEQLNIAGDVDNNWGNSGNHLIERHRLALYYHIVRLAILGAAKPT